MSFDRLAPIYRTLEGVLAGGILQRCRTAHMAETVGRQRAVLMGEGPGRFLAAMLRATPRIEVTVVEKSPRMIREARSRIQKEGLDASRVDFQAVDASTWNPPVQSFDLIVTHFFLDCFSPDDLEDIIGKLAGSATTDARWLLGDFCIPERGWRRFRARVIHSAMYTFFRTATGITAKQVTSPDPILRGKGFRLISRRLFNRDLIHSDLWARTGP